MECSSSVCKGEGMQLYTWHLARREGQECTRLVESASMVVDDEAAAVVSLKTGWDGSWAAGAGERSRKERFALGGWRGVGAGELSDETPKLKVCPEDEAAAAPAHHAILERLDRLRPSYSSWRAWHVHNL